MEEEEKNSIVPKMAPEIIKALRPHALWWVTLIICLSGFGVAQWLQQHRGIALLVCVAVAVVCFWYWYEQRRWKRAMVKAGDWERTCNQETAALRERIQYLENSRPPEVAEAQRIERLPLGTPFDLYASPKPTITPPLRQREARKQWSSLNSGQKTVVEHVLLYGRVTLAELLSWMKTEGIDGGIDTVRSIMGATNFLQGGRDEGYWANPEFKTQLEELIGS